MANTRSTRKPRPNARFLVYGEPCLALVLGVACLGFGHGSGRDALPHGKSFILQWLRGVAVARPWDLAVPLVAVELAQLLLAAHRERSKTLRAHDALGRAAEDKRGTHGRAALGSEA